MKKVPLSPHALAIIDAQREQFIRKFGREPGPSDPIFFDPDADTPTPYSEDRLVDETLLAFVEANIAGQLIWAYIRTGLIVGEETWPLLSKRDRKAWKAAIREYDEGKADVDAYVAQAKRRLGRAE
jgi:hypothetical protein